MHIQLRQRELWDL